MNPAVDHQETRLPGNLLTVSSQSLWFALLEAAIFPPTSISHVIETSCSGFLDPCHLGHEIHQMLVECTHSDITIVDFPM